jgi:methyl-accepting chemotaxis protein
MGSMWTFGRKLGLGFAVIIAIAIVIAVIAVVSLKSAISSSERVISVNATTLTNAAQLNTTVMERMAANRGYLLTRDSAFLDQIRQGRDEFKKIMAALRSRLTNVEAIRLLDQIEQISGRQLVATDRVIEAAHQETSADALAKLFEANVMPANREMRAAVDRFEAFQIQEMDDAKHTASTAAESAIKMVVGIAIAGVVLAIVMGFLLSRSLGKQIGSAVRHVQSSATELQAAANQQTTSSKEQVAAMTEISTTVKELLLTAKQIADSAKRVAQIAGDTANAAEAGDAIVKKAQDEVLTIRQQVDAIVTHMLDLGKKSQQIGGIVEIINELADQTNILAINATIEAAGAGEAGKRFSAVADEIRDLADRVGGSTKEIRSLIEQIRSAVHTTVMATESGSKAVDAGTRQFGDVAAAFQQITGLLGTTTEAAREIELSTKQQSSAVEQVNVAVANVSQAAKESEASSSQVLQTVSELTGLSRDLAKLIQHKAAA